MAAEGFVTFLDANMMAFYFRDYDTDVEEDSFQLKCAYLKWIKSNNNKFLTLTESNEFKAQNLSRDEQPEHQFNVQVYANSDKVGQRGVILFASQDGRKLVVCCNDQQEVHPVEMEVPRNVGEEAHKALFYRTRVSPCRYLLESSVHASMFLAFEEDVSNHTLSRLVLRHKERDEVDESCCITMEEVPPQPTASR